MSLDQINLQSCDVCHALASDYAAHLQWHLDLHHDMSEVACHIKGPEANRADCDRARYRGCTTKASWLVRHHGRDTPVCTTHLIEEILS